MGNLQGFIARLKQAMEEKRINQTQLAALLGVSVVTVSNTLKGIVQKPRYVEIADALGVDAHWLRYGGDNPEPKMTSNHAVNNTENNIAPMTNNYYTGNGGSNNNAGEKIERLERQLDRMEQQLGRMEQQLNGIVLQFMKK